MLVCSRIQVETRHVSGSEDYDALHPYSCQTYRCTRALAAPRPSGPANEYADLRSQNAIKRQARENPPFRRVCVSFAQSLHRLDIRLRLGLLQDTAAIDAQIARDAERETAKRANKEAADRAKAKGLANGPAEHTVKTEAEAMREDVENAQ